MDADIVFTCERHIGLITLNRPQALNALTLSMIMALQQKLLAWKNDNNIHAVVIQAAPGKAFCAGGDVRWLYDRGREKGPQPMQFFWHEYRLNHYIHHFNKPYIAMMDGINMGGGVGVSLHGSHPVASEHFTFAMPETSIGFFPDIGASYLLSHCPGQFGAYLGLTGNRLGAGDAYQLGLVKQVISSSQFPELLSYLIDMELSKDAHVQVSACLQRFALKEYAAPIMEHQAAINTCFGYQDVESIMQELAILDDDWHRETMHNLLKKAPLSLKVTLAQIQKAKGMSLADCLKMDYCLASHFMQDQDFYEGVRALLVDKDKNPRWQPSFLSNVNDATVADYFECGESTLSLID